MANGLKKYALALDIVTEDLLSVCRAAVGAENVLVHGDSVVVCYVWAASLRAARERLFDRWCAVSGRHFPVAFSEIRVFGR